MIGAAILSAVSVALVTGSVATPPNVARYDCMLSHFSSGDDPAPRVLNEGEKAKIGLPFELEATSMPGGLEMRIHWKGDPFHLTGVHGAAWSNEGRAWLMNGPLCEDGGDFCAVFLSLGPVENGEAHLVIMPGWPTKNHPQPWVRDEFDGTCKPSGNLK
ncbi:MAG: hypothetical protein V4574_12650 [Pseudomonadota bacterium]